MTERELASVKALLTMRPELNPESGLVEPPFFIHTDRATGAKTLVIYLPDGRLSQKMLNILCNRYFPGSLEEAVSCHVMHKQDKMIMEISANNAPASSR